MTALNTIPAEENDGYYTVAWKDGYPYPYLEFTCRANDSWDDLSDEC